MDLRKKVRMMMTLNGLKAIGKIKAQIEFLSLSKEVITI